MPNKQVSSSAALKTSVALLREGIGPGASDAFVLAPLWVPGVGCMGLITIADIPYATPPPATGSGGGGGGGGQRKPVRRRRRQQHEEGTGPSGRAADEGTNGGVESHVRHAVGPGLVEFTRRVGVALGTAAFRLRKKSLVARIKAEEGRYSLHGGKASSENDANQRLSLSSPPLPPLRQTGQMGSSRRGASAAREKR